MEKLGWVCYALLVYVYVPIAVLLGILRLFSDAPQPEILVKVAGTAFILVFVLAGNLGLAQYRLRRKREQSQLGYGANNSAETISTVVFVIMFNGVIPIWWLSETLPYDTGLSSLKNLNKLAEAGFCVCMAVFVILAIWHHRLRGKRAQSLFRDEAGFYVWIDLTGTRRQSAENPSLAGGEWDIEDGSSGDGDGGDGGDGGGGGD